MKQEILLLGLIFLLGISLIQIHNVSALVASGGTVSFDGNYEIHTFTSNGTLTVTKNGTMSEILMIAGGGGGGGAGGFKDTLNFFVAVGSYTVTVGSGGASDKSGLNSQFSGIADAVYGGHGGSFSGGFNGGSGGGGSGHPGGGGFGGGTGTSGQGHNGGPGDYQGGGGGSATETGDHFITGNGGAGKSSLISGANVTYAAGGGGGNSTTQTGGSFSGGVGGGGNGAASVNGIGSDATGIGSGGGGGGGNVGNNGGGKGSKGIVIFRFLSPSIVDPSVTDPRLESSGEQRTSYFDGIRNWVFYYNATSQKIVYRSSTDGGISWSAPGSIGNGQPLLQNSYFGIWGNGTNKVIVTWTNSTRVLTQVGNITGSTIFWNSAKKVAGLTSTNSGQNYYPSFEKVGNSLFLGFNVVNSSNTNFGKVFVSTGPNFGNSWSYGITLQGPQTYPAPVGVAQINTTKAVAMYAKYNDTFFQYKIYDGTKWLTTIQNTTNVNLTANTNKTSAFSITSNGTCAWVGYVANNTGGPLKSMKFCGGSSYSFPSTSVTGKVRYPSISAIGNDIHLFYVNSTNNIIGRIINTGGVWGQIDNPFGKVFSSPAYLHSQKYGFGGHHVPVEWREGNTSPFTVKFGITNIVWDTGSVVSSTAGMPTVPASGKQAESSVAVYPQNPKILITSLMSLGTNGGQNNDVDIYRSTDGGNSWINQTVLNRINGYIIADDPVVTTNTTGAFYVVYLNHDNSGSFPYSANDIDLATSVGGGQSWPQSQYQVLLHMTNGTGQDKPWIVADTSSNSTTKNHIYLCWTTLTTSQRIDFKRIVPPDPNNQTLQTFPNRGNFVNGCNMSIGPAGQIILSWENFTSSSSGNINVLRNYNGGAKGSWTPITVAGTFHRFPTQIPPCNATVGCIGGLDGKGIRVTNYPSVGVDNRSFVHIVYTNSSTISGGDIQYVESTNCKKYTDPCTFSNATKINIDPYAKNSTADQFEPVLIISNETSPQTIHVTVNDRRDDPKNVFWIPYDYHCHLNVDCTKVGNWTNNMIVNRQSTNYDRDYFAGDYHGLTFSKFTEAIANWNDYNNTTTGYDIWGDITR